MSKNHLLIFVKNPKIGKVKTRLAKTLGEQEALRIYKILLQKTKTACLDCDAEKTVFYSDHIPKKDLFPKKEFPKKLQISGDLGFKMQMAFAEIFAQNTEKALIIGSDCPYLSSAILADAFSALDTHDFVLGPALDGGYYLLGMKHYAPSVFENIEWSTAEVAEKTLKNISTLSKTCFHLPALEDIDTEEEWTRFLNSQFAKLPKCLDFFTA